MREVLQALGLHPRMLGSLIFLLTLDPFLKKVQSNPDIRGLTLDNTEFKLAAFAKDILFFLSAS